MLQTVSCRVFRLLVAVAAFVGTPSAARALDPQKALSACTVEVFGMRDGLTGARVAALAQTPDGYLWIGGLAGLRRYDGARVVRVDEPPLRVVGLSTALEGTLVVSTDTGARHCGRGGALQPCGAVQADVTVRPGEPSVRDAQGRRFVGGEQGLFIEEAGQRRRMFDQRGPIVERVVSLVAGRQAVWVLTDWSLIKIAPDQGVGLRLEVPLAGRPRSQMIEDRDGNLWMGSDAGLVRFHDPQFTVFTQRDGLPDDDVTALLEDREGSLWVGTRRGALAQFTDRTVSTLTVLPELRDQPVEAIAEDEAGVLWAGSWRGLHSFDGVRARWFSRTEGLPTDRVYALWPGRAHQLFVGTHVGLIRRQGEQFQRLPFDRTVYSLFQDSRGAVWIGGADGLFRFSDGRVSPIDSGTLRPGQIRGIAEDGQGRIWLTSAGAGLMRVNSDRLVAVPGAPRADRGIGRTRDGTLWFGAGRQLVRLRDGTITTFGQAEGWIDEVVYQVLGDDRFLWLTTSRALVRIGLASLDEVAERQRTRIDLMSLETSDRRGEISGRRSRTPGAWRTHTGSLWFATQRGVLTVDPGRLRANTALSPVLIQEALVDGRPATPDGRNHFPPGRGNLEFHFAAVTLVEPQKAAHRYRLDGFDDRWIEAGPRRVAYYTNLPPGRYTFRVQAANADGLWNLAGASLALVIAPHFYQTGWFYAGVALALGVLAWLGHRARLARLRAEVLAVFAERGRMARELHDALLQNMTAVALEVENIRDRLSPSLPERQRLQDVERTLATSLEETRQMVRNLRGQSSTVSDLGLALGRLTQRLEGGGVRCTLNVEGERWPLDPEAQGAFFRVAQEATSNALKHARPTHIDVRLVYRPDEVTLTIHDDGAGFVPARAPGAEAGHFGLAGMSERAERLGATLLVESAPGRGTRVVLVLARRQRRSIHG